MKLITLLFSIFLGWTASFSQNPQDAHPNWGVGVIVPAAGNEVSVYGVAFPRSPIAAYDRPNGIPGGSIQSKETIELSIMVYEEGNTALEIPELAYREVDYEQSGMLAYAQQGDWVAVKVSEEGKFRWIKISDLNALNYQYMSWEKFLMARKSGFYPEPAQGLNLRKGPGTNHPVVTKLTSDNHIIELTGQKEGLWMEVKVQLWPVHPCSGGEKPSATYTGWIKALDDKGFPNIWFPTRGC